MSSPTFAAMEPVYSHLWLHADILPSRISAIQKSARLVLSNKERYQKVEATTGVPWYLVGCLHLREAGCSFKSHLHNGDPLTARTRHVPANRPPHGNPPFTWEASADDALRMRGLDKVTDWTIERVAYEAEGYNGWGYAFKHLLSPYDFSGMDDPDRPGWQEVAHGKYVADHVFDASVIDQQPGVMSVLKAMAQLDPSILGHAQAPAPKPLPVPEAPKAPEAPVKPQTVPQGSPPVRSPEPPAIPGPSTSTPGLIGTIITLFSAILKAFSKGK